MAAFQGDSIFWIETSKIVPNPYQPRREFDEARLKELAESIRMYGVLQPLTVSRKEVHGEDGAFRTEYELIAGERRLRASKLAGVEQVPVIIREGEDSEQEKLELAIIENLQREDLNAVDRALAFKQLADVFELSHAQVAKKVGRSREYVSNSIRLLNLPEYMLDSVKTADISEGHARTLLMLNDRPEEQDTLYREILLKKLTVREVERIARKVATDKVRKQQWKGSDPELIEKEKQFTETLGTRVQLTKTDYGGKITIDYFSDEDLDLLLATIARNRAAGVEPSVSAVTSAAAAMSAASTTSERDAALDTLSQSTPLQAEPTAAPQANEVSQTLEPAETVSEPELPAIEPDVSADPATNGAETESVIPASSSTPAPAVTEASVVPQAQPATPPSSLRAKLSQLFSEPAQPASPVISETVSEPAPAQMDSAAPQSASDQVERSIAAEASHGDTQPVSSLTPHTPTPPAPEKSNDDEDLYGVKNFTV